MRIIYVACPLTPTSTETRHLNIHRAKTIYEVLCYKHPDHAFLMPWVMNAEVFQETRANRDLGMMRNYAIIERCDELWLVGPRVSEGMVLEADYAKRKGLVVVSHVGAWASGRVPTEF
jgi:hypothetical protein